MSTGQALKAIQDVDGMIFNNQIMKNLSLIFCVQYLIATSELL